MPQRLKIVLKPVFLILIAAVLALLLLAITLIDIYRNQQEIYRTNTEEAVLLIKALQKSGESTFLGNLELERSLLDKLVNCGFMIAEMERTTNLEGIELNEVARGNKIDHIYIYDERGKLLTKNSWMPYAEFNVGEKYPSEIDSLINGKYDYFIAGAVEDIKGEQHLLVMHARSRGRGVIALSLNAGQLLDFKKRIGIGQLFNSIAAEENIIYIVIQDSSGIVVSSKGTDQLNSIEQDPFLSRALRDGLVYTRNVEYRGEEIFETVKSFMIAGESAGLMRIGLSLKKADEMIIMGMYKSIAIAVFFLFAGTLIFAFVINNQNYHLLKNEYQKMQSYTEKILSSMSDAVVAADREGRILLFNQGAEKIFLQPQMDAVGKNCREIISHPESLIDRTLREDRPVEGWEDIVTLRNGEKRILAGATSIIRDGKGMIDSVVAVMRDLTLQRRMEEKQSRQEKYIALGELAAGVAHEIRNPLNAIGINVQRLGREFEPQQEGEEYYGLISNMKSEIARVSRIIEEYLRFARPPALNRSSFLFKDIVEEVLLSFAEMARLNGVELRSITDATEITADAAQIKQVLVNLTKNAIEAVAAEGKVVIESFRLKDHLIINVIDTGVGIAEKDLNKIFNIYYSTKPEGTGMGLAVVYRIVSEHEGTINVANNAEKGTKFTINLPLT